MARTKKEVSKVSSVQVKALLKVPDTEGILGQYKRLNMLDQMEKNKKLRVFIAGQKYFGEQVLRLCIDHPRVEVVGVSCPPEDKYIGSLAALFEIPIIPAGTLNGDNFPDGVDLGIAAHSFDYVGRRTRYKARLGWIGYHPSLLPLHRGRSAIEWAIRMREPVTGGTVFWLNAGIDRGDIAYQEHVFIKPAYWAMKPKEAARELWRLQLLPLGVHLMKQAIDDISQGIIKRTPQDPELSTFEPSTDVKDIFKPDLLMLPEGKNHKI